MPRFVVLLLLAACTQPPAPRPVEPPRPAPVVVDAPPARPAREVFAVAPSPMSIAIAGDTLAWTDATGSIWTMPTAGGAARKLETPDHAFKVVAAGDAFVASTRKDVLAVDLAAGTAAKQNLRLAELPEDIVADASAVYVTLFKKTAILRIAGGRAQKIGDLARGILAIDGDTLYAASYATGAVVAIPTAGGKPRTIARGLVRPTALAVDATHAYVYSEQDRSVHRIALATGARDIIARDLVNSDELVADGDWLYTRSWQGKIGTLVRIAKDGSRQDAIGADLAAPYGIAVDADAVYVTARDAAQIVRFAKSALPP